ncbi:hypothetical protein QCD85_08840 [Paenibacillus sp. PsM32]|uniref:Uncharacterized protein n=1 Tax=Paenibacillus kyungheensis TaxID=1452732 RepID=A0AAX3LVS8_9BACL|nr:MULTISPECIES: hypothetical protein [Paenibacillus]MDN4618200.1 hypothetical protein [Paenibacillus sp. PsM32]MDQ1234224.1 hypothetical protein [Paenibacillus sp. SORGH_AS_0306]MDR6111270.1 hypothetical protein [Paenibacillus sp. SORGH_AS_0338]WCT53845.1 hypothetical protein PQ456_11530 [Paenibacillus kyungheensis]
MLLISGLLLWILLCIFILLSASYAATDKVSDIEKKNSKPDDPFAYLFPL